MTVHNNRTDPQGIVQPGNKPRRSIVARAMSKRWSPIQCMHKTGDVTEHSGLDGLANIFLRYPRIPYPGLIRIKVLIFVSCEEGR